MQNRIHSRVKCVGTDATDQEYAINTLPDKARVISAYIVPNVSVATHASNYITLTVGSTIFAFNTSSGTGAAMTAGTVIASAITGSGTTIECAAGALISVGVAKSGTGPAYDFDVVLVLEGIRQ